MAVCQPVWKYFRNLTISGAMDRHLCFNFLPSGKGLDRGSDYLYTNSLRASVHPSPSLSFLIHRLGIGVLASQVLVSPPGTEQWIQRCLSVQALSLYVCLVPLGTCLWDADSTTEDASHSAADRAPSRSREHL